MRILIIFLTSFCLNLITSQEFVKGQERENEFNETQHQLLFQFGSSQFASHIGGSYTQPLNRRFGLRIGLESNRDKGAATLCGIFRIGKFYNATLYNFLGVERRFEHEIGLNCGIGNQYYVSRHFVLMLEIGLFTGAPLPSDQNTINKEFIKFRGGFGLSL